MSIFSKIAEGVVTLAKFVIGIKPEPGAKLDDPLGELETEKVKRTLEDKRRERNSRKHGRR